MPRRRNVYKMWVTRDGHEYVLEHLYGDTQKEARERARWLRRHFDRVRIEVVRPERREGADPARVPSAYETLYVVQGNYGYGHGWEDLTAEKSWKEAKQQLRTYRENESAPFRVIKRRVHRETGQAYRRPSPTSSSDPARRRGTRARRDYVLTYGRSAISKPHAMLTSAVKEAKALSLPSSFGGEVAVIERHGYSTREIGRARRGSFFESSARRDPRRSQRRDPARHFDVADAWDSENDRWRDENETWPVLRSYTGPNAREKAEDYAEFRNVKEGWIGRYRVTGPWGGGRDPARRRARSRRSRSR